MKKSARAAAMGVLDLLEFLAQWLRFGGVFP
jgi:hypothetical protein